MTSPASSAPSLPGEQVASEDRGERLLREYQEVESALRGRGIRHFIAVFGSTRLPQENRFCHMARELGGIVAREARGAGDGAALVTGGGPGVMAAANRGAFEAGGVSAGMNITLASPQAANPYITPGLGFSFRYFALRKLHFMLRARALVAFPGGFGTLDELFETLMLVQTAKVPPLPVVLAGEAHWRRAVDLPYLVECGVLTDEDRRLFCYADSAPAIWEAIAGWYRVRGEAVFPARSIYPGHLARERVLPDGRPVLIRPIRPEDELQEQRFLARLSPDTRRKRFQQWAGRIDGELAHFYANIDYDRHMAFVCAARDEQGDRLVGEARYVANPGGESCEFGIVVADDWQHTGVAQLLMRALMAAAGERGIRTMGSVVLASNAGMLDFARELGFALEPAAEDPRVVRITKALGSS